MRDHRPDSDIELPLVDEQRFLYVLLNDKLCCLHNAWTGRYIPYVLVRIFFLLSSHDCLLCCCCALLHRFRLRDDS